MRPCASPLAAPRRIYKTRPSDQSLGGAGASASRPGAIAHFENRYCYPLHTSSHTWRARNATLSLAKQYHVPIQKHIKRSPVTSPNKNMSSWRRMSCRCPPSLRKLYLHAHVCCVFVQIRSISSPQLFLSNCRAHCASGAGVS